MAEYSSTKNNNDASESASIFSLILSHPLYFSYLILFSPYIFKILSFLSPIFITTSLLFLSLLPTFIPLHSLGRLRPGFDHEAYRFLFETLIIEAMEQHPDERDVFQELGCEKTGDAKKTSKVKKYDSVSIRDRFLEKVVLINKELKTKSGLLRLDCEKKLSEAFYQTVGRQPDVGKLLFFLSPLFNTTSFLFLSVLTTFLPLRSFTKPNEGFLDLLENLRPGSDDGGEDSQPIEKFEAYRIVSETPTIEPMEQYPDERDVFEETPVVGLSEMECEKTGDAKKSITLKEKVKKYESVFMRDRFLEKDVSTNKELKTKIDSLRLDREKKLSEAFHQTVGRQPDVGSYFGSMRKERVWRRTLACKLFEERYNGGYTSVSGQNNDDEGMDMLWEIYETESKMEETEEKKGLMAVKEEDDDDDEDYDNRKVCCLQTLKLSAGKMNLSMGRPSLIKFGKVFKGMGWLHKKIHAKKQGKKLYK